MMYFRVLNRPTIFPLPEIVAKTVFGEMGEELLLGGQKVIPTKLLRAGFNFENQNVEESIRASL
jgi:NAD dependent epimerase/dehydratase family enzyme